jgi:hypothetical protein
MDANGLPILLLSGLAAHTKHLRGNPACALLIICRLWFLEKFNKEVQYIGRFANAMNLNISALQQ